MTPRVMVMSARMQPQAIVIRRLQINIKMLLGRVPYRAK
jgi:hypothetical protein